MKQALVSGSAFYFKSTRYIGLNPPHMKRNVWVAYLRSYELHYEMGLQVIDRYNIVFLNQAKLKVFLSIPISDIQNKTFEIIQSDNLHPNIEIIKIDNINNDSLFVWDEYIDRWAIRQIALNVKQIKNQT